MGRTIGCQCCDDYKSGGRVIVNCLYKTCECFKNNAICGVDCGCSGKCMNNGEASNNHVREKNIVFCLKSKKMASIKICKAITKKGNKIVLVQHRLMPKRNGVQIPRQGSRNR